MNSLLNYGLLFSLIGCFVEVDGSCETTISSDLFYNTETYKWEVVCPDPEHLFKLGERKMLSGCRECVCHASGLVCCRVDEGVGSMNVPEDCEVVSDDSTCEYQVLRRDDHTPCF